MSRGAIFISWESHTRSKGLAELLGIPLYEILVPGNHLKRYLISAAKTLDLVRKQDPSVVIIQNPSIVLAAISVLFFSKRRKVVMDAHNAAVYPLEGRHGILNRLAWSLLRKSFLVLVTNDALHREVQALGAKPFVLPDPIPSPRFPRSQNTSGDDKTVEVVLVCTWAKDEPYLEFLEAAGLLSSENLKVKMTGKPPERIRSRPLPENVELTGFVSKDQYWKLLSEASVIVDLTTRENCLVCGAYEAAAVGVPCVLSDTEAARKMFTGGYAFVKNEPRAIAEGILSATRNRGELQLKMGEFVSGHTELMRQKTVEFRAKLGI